MPSYAALLGQLYRLTSTAGDAELLRRWVDQRDEDAFAALVARHGRMVHGVCRRVLGNRHDAEDAFQAVFLILARKAGAIRHPEALSGWLHGVAVRVAYKARIAAVRWRCREADPSTAESHDPHPDPLDALSARELLALIDREIARLPEVYRLPLVLCDLEVRTQAEAAALLGWTLGSLRGRLLRGRERLRIRLARRGLAPAVLAAGFMRCSAEATALTAGVSGLAVRFAANPALADVSPSVAALVRSGIRGMLLAKLKLASAALLVTSTLVAGAGLLAWPDPTPQPPAEARAESKPLATPTIPKPPVRHDRAGDPLPNEALSRLGTTRFRDGGSFAIGRDGKTLVSCGRGGVRVWDIANGKEIPRFPQELPAYSLALSPDGKELAIRVRTDNPAEPSIAIHEYATGRLLRRFGDRQALSLLSFSPDGKVLAASLHVLSASDWRRQTEIDLWDPADGRRLHILIGHKGHVGSIAFSPDSKTLVSIGDDKTIRFWDVATGKELRQIKHYRGTGSIAWSPDGKLLASTHLHFTVEPGGGYREVESHVSFWDVTTGKELRQLVPPALERFPTGGIFFRLIFAPNSKTLLTGGNDGVVRVWDPATGTELRQFPGFAGSPGDFVFTPDGKGLAVVEGGTTIRLLDFATGKDLVPTFGHRSRVTSMSVAPDGRTVATLSDDNTLRFWELETGRELRSRSMPPLRGYMFTRRFQDDGKTYLTVGVEKLYRLMDLASGKEMAVLHGHKTSYPFALSPDGKALASVNSDKEVRLLDPATGAIRHMLTRVQRFVTGMAFSGDSQTLVVWDSERNVTVWDVATGKKRRQFPVPTEMGRKPGDPRTRYTSYQATLSPDGKRIAFGLKVFDPKAKQGILPVLDTSTGKEVCRFPTGKGGEDGMTFSPDSKSLVWAEVGTDAIVLGEIATGRERHHFTGSTGSINSIYSAIYAFAFSPDGKRLVSSSDDTTALVWDLTGRFMLGNKFNKALSAQELDTYWKALAGEDAAAGFRAVQALAADPIHSVPYLRTHLHPVARADEKLLQQWIADLDSEQLSVRTKAVSELEKAGAATLHAMRKALEERPTLEIRRRLEQLIEKKEREEWLPSAENLRSRRALEVLERVGTAESKDVLTSLTNGAPGAWQTLDAKATLERLTQRPDGK